VRLFGDLPAASISTGRLPTGAALAMAGVLLAGGTWRLPELTQVRRRFARWRGRNPALLFPLACIGVCLGAICTVDLLKPDGRLHVEPLDSAGGQAVFVRAPSGESALIVAGRIDPTTLTDQLADRLAVWEHRLNRAVALDDASNIALTRVLSRYPADERVESTGAIQLDLRGPAVVNAALARDGQLRVEVETARSGPTTSAARPESAN
jgi:hypothetical protein